MEKTYFFISKRVGGTMTFFPLLSQTDTTNYAIDPHIRLRPTSEDRSIACNHVVENTIWGAKVEGPSAADCILTYHSTSRGVFYTCPTRLYPLGHFNDQWFGINIINVTHFITISDDEIRATNLADAKPLINEMVEELRSKMPSFRLVGNEPDSRFGEVLSTRARTLCRYIRISRDVDNRKAELLEDLETGILKFRYMKRDGSVRYATGTRNPAIIRFINPNANLASQNEVGNSLIESDSICYFDFLRRDWRTFVMSRLLSGSTSYSNPTIQEVTDLFTMTSR